jgi:hypothetical protein
MLRADVTSLKIDFVGHGHLLDNPIPELTLTIGCVFYQDYEDPLVTLRAHYPHPPPPLSIRKWSVAREIKQISSLSQCQPTSVFMRQYL